MSITEEDPELRELVVQTLESNGVLGKIKAQLRASVFLALDEEEKINPLVNDSLNSFAGSFEGTQVILLFREFLQFYNLEYTLSVFEPETNTSTQCNREKLARDLSINDVGDVRKHPLICEILKRGSKPKTLFEENHLDLGTLLMEKTQHKLVIDSDCSTNRIDDKFTSLENFKKKTFDEKEGNSVSLKTGEAVKALKWDKTRVPSGDSDPSTEHESTKSVSSLSAKQKSLKSPRGLQSGDDDYDDYDIEEDINEEGSLTNQSESIPNVRDDITSDRTISPADQSAACDYLEEVLKIS